MRNDYFAEKKEVFVSIREGRLPHFISIAWNIMKRRISYTANFCQRKIPFLILSKEQISTTSYLVIFVHEGIKYLFLQEAKIMKNGHSSLLLSRNLIWSIHVDYFSVPQWPIIRGTFHFSKGSFLSWDSKHISIYLFFDISKAEKEFEFNRLKKYFKDLSSSLKFV